MRLCKFVMLLPALMINNVLAAGPATIGGQAGILNMLPMMLGIIVLFYFMIIRPQKKRAEEQRKLMEAVNIDDDVLTSGGLYGKITAVADDILTVEIANNVRIKLQRQSIAKILPKGSISESGQ